MNAASEYPSNTEVREWAIAKRPDLVQRLGTMPNFVIVAWNRAHPDRPYVKSQAYHGTTNGYSKRNCRCARCAEAWNAYRRDVYALDAAERTDELADELLGGAS